MGFDVVQHHDSCIRAEDFVLPQREVWSGEHSETSIGEGRFLQDQSIRQTVQCISSGTLHIDVILVINLT